MKKIVLATNNSHKIQELKNISKELNIEFLTKSEIGQGDFDVEETEETLEGNALLKAKGLKKLIGDYIVISDDTGLFVDYLNGEPGVHSSRYSGEDHNDEKNKEKLLENLKDVSLENRNAHFKTVIAVVEDGKDDIIVEGVLKGKIAEEERGTEGFGYDPLFIPEGYDKTFSQMGIDEKNKISHRYRALNALIEKLKERF